MLLLDKYPESVLLSFVDPTPNAVDPPSKTEVSFFVQSLSNTDLLIISVTLLYLIPSISVFKTSVLIYGGCENITNGFNWKFNWS